MTITQDRIDRIRATVGDRQIEGITAERLSGILTGQRRATSLEYALIADACQVTVGWLLTGTDDEALMLERLAQRHHPHPIPLEQMRDRWERGGDTYRKLLWRGHGAFLEALGMYSEAAMQDAPEHARRMLEALYRHEVSEPAYRIAIEYWCDNYGQASKQAWEAPDGGPHLIAEAHYVKMAVFEYTWPGNQDEILRMVPPKQ